MAVHRHEAREMALQVLFSWETRGKSEGRSINDELALINAHYFQKSEEDIAFARMILLGIVTHVPALREKIEQFAPEWPYEKIALMDRCIMAIGLFEILFNDEVPDVVAINEAIELAKTFGDDASPKFINGVLHAVKEHK